MVLILDRSYYWVVFIAKLFVECLLLFILCFQVLICRNYRGDIDMSVIDKFMPMVMDMEDDGLMSPIIQHNEITFIFIKYNNLYLVATSKKNANVAMVFSFLHKLVQVRDLLCSLNLPQTKLFWKEEGIIIGITLSICLSECLVSATPHYRSTDINDTLHSCRIGWGCAWKKIISVRWISREIISSAKQGAPFVIWIIVFTGY
mgnify:FL=1